MESLDFQKQVLDKSFDKPVLVDFWAPWCGPCLMLAPIIEELAEEQADKWDLVKVNTDEHTELATHYRVMGIPNVKMFFKGRVLAEFSGVLSKVAIQKWLEEKLPSPQKIALFELLEKETVIPDPELMKSLNEIYLQHPELKEAKMALARHLVFSEPEEAKALLTDIRLGDPLHPYKEDIFSLSTLMELQEDQETPVGKALVEAKLALHGSDPETGIQKIIEATSIDKSFSKEMPRRAAIALFHIWGNHHELTKKYRRQFDMVLY